MKRIAHYQYLEYVRVMSLMRQYQAASAAATRAGLRLRTREIPECLRKPGHGGHRRRRESGLRRGRPRKGFQAYEPEAFFATTQDPFDVVFLSHLIEHVTPDALVALVPRLCARLARNGRMIMLSPTPGERFYHDFSHIRPYLPQSIRHAFGATGMPISYGEAGLLEMVDIHFFKDPYRTRLWRSFYVNRGIKGAFTRQYNRLLDVLWRASGGRIGKTASWLGVYELRARS
jgi:SAM-dependent methyltransferase